MESFYVSLLSLFVLLVSLSLHFLFYKNKSAPAAGPLPPGKTGWPVVGESLEFLSTGWKGHPEKFISDRIARYSSHVFKTHLLGEKAAVFCGASGNKFLFSNENKLVQAWWPSSVDKVFPSSSAQSSSKEEAIKMRKMLPNFLKPEALQRYVGVMDRIAQRHFSEGWENKEDVVVFPLAKNYTFRLACRLFVSIEDAHHVDRLAEPFNLLASGLISVPVDLPGTPFSRAIKASKFIRKELVAIIKQRKIDLAEGKASPAQDILSHMMLTCDENGKFMHELDIADKILGLLIGGHDTASSACTFIVKYLAELPQIYQQVHKVGGTIHSSGVAPATPEHLPGSANSRVGKPLKVFYHSVKEDERVTKLDGMGHLARLMVETGKDLSFPLFYRILKLALVLPVATATVERCFSKMKLIKTVLRNRMGDEYLNNAMVCAVERETFDEVTNEDVMERFKNMKDRRGEF
ncbi:hypothetical protein OROMI_012576 [Orobanche minor]